jgi:hypothetical protein
MGRLRSLLLVCASLSTAAQARSPVPIDVYGYGAAGDGVSDDTAAIQSALTAGRVTHKAVFFSSGIYRFTRTLVADGTTINCSGNNNTTLLLDDPSGRQDGITIGHATFNMSGCVYNRMQVGTAGALLHFTDSYFASIHNNRFDGPSYNVVTVDSDAFMPNEIFIHDNIVHNFTNDFVFGNSQHADYPVYDLHAYNNFSRSSGNAHYEIAGYGQIDLHHNIMTGGAAYSLKVKTASLPSVNTLDYIQSNDFDTGSAVYIANHNADVITGNEIEGPLTLVNVTNAHIVGNDMTCGTNTCPVLMRGVVALNFSGNKISGQHNPITIQPAGAEASSDLSFLGNTWVFGSGSFLTFNGGSPATNNITVLLALQGAERLATFTTPPTNFRNLGSTSGSDAAPTFAMCTGVGATGSCALSPGSTNEVGTISLNTAGGGEFDSGIVQMTYSAAVGPRGSTCTLTPQNGSGSWIVPPTILQQGTTATYMNFMWINGDRTTLRDSVQYQIEYSCRGL